MLLQLLFWGAVPTAGVASVHYLLCTLAPTCCTCNAGRRPSPTECLAHTYPAALLCVKCVNLCRQEAFFHYLFGVCDREDCWGALDLRTQRAFLFIPRCACCGL